MHVMSEPNILYFGTPVVVLSTVNEDGSYNLAPMSSVFWLGWRVPNDGYVASMSMRGGRLLNLALEKLAGKPMLVASNPETLVR